MADYVYENLPVAIRRKDDFYEIGAVIHGGFFAFGAFKAGGFEEDLQEAQVAEQSARDEAQRQAALAASHQGEQNAPQG